MTPRRSLAILVCLVSLAGFEAHAFAQDAAGASAGASAGESPGESVGASPGESVGASAGESVGESVGADEDDGRGPLEFELPVFGRTTFGMVSTTTVRYRGQNYDANANDDDFVSLQQRFDLSLQGEDLRLDVRLDGFLPMFFEGGLSIKRVCPEGAETLCYLESNARPERMTLRWTHDEFTVEAGDHYAVLGRGLALSFRKYDLLGVDNALRGGRITYESRRFQARIVGGVSNPQNIDPTNLQLIRDPDDLVFGAELGTRIGENDDVEFAAHVSHVAFEDDEDGRQTDRDVTVVGWHAAAPALFDGKLALYAEVDALLRSWDTSTGAERSSGRAVYASAQLQLDRATLLAEWVDYRNFMVASSTNSGTTHRIYSSMPTMELDGLQRLRAVGNRRGGSLKFDYAFQPSAWSVSANALVYGLNEQDADPWDGSLVMHGWVGARRFNDGSDPGWTLEVLGGYRREIFLHDPGGGVVGAGSLDRDVVHGEVDGTLALGSEHSLEMRIDHRYDREWRGLSYAGYHQGGVTMTWTWNVKLSISPSLRWNDEKANVVELRGERDYNFLGGRMYPAIEARWNFTPSNFVSVFAGSTPGGRLCSGGVCRDVQAFEGVLAQLVMRI